MGDTTQDTQSFDYIIYGGGTTGCVIAGRLAERSDASVLLLRPDHQGRRVSQILGTEADWNIQSEPCAELNDRKLHLGRGKFLGGSSGTNGTICTHGIKQDYDDWNMEGWSGDEMFEYMKRVENFQSTDWFVAETVVHGANGPFFKGFPIKDDMFTTGESPQGCGHAVRSIYKGIRTCSTDYLDTAESKTKVTIISSQYVCRIITEPNGEGQKLCATAVQVQDASGASTIHKATKEIILTAGVYGSPGILLRPGIGPSAELKELGISPVIDIPGVGENLINHLVMLSFYEVSKPGLTNDHLIWHTRAKEKIIQQYKESRTGFMSQFPFGVFALTRFDLRLKDVELWQKSKRSNDRDPMNTLPNQPHVEFWNTECYSPKYRFKDFPPDNKYAFAMATTFFSTRSRGEMTLKSTDPLLNPKVQHNFLANEIALEGAGTKDIIAADDDVAVVDGNICVRGVGGLRVADASIMPTLMSGHPQMAVFAIGEKAADLLLSSCALQICKNLHMPQTQIGVYRTLFL
ncbi:GMC oxidoreductase [Lentithecium fluviatile CBS 122367]|uniref:GMC oxidoreductase n=1 Tax=Lentithecium fluviatile CBS 122367 TaxID=1168545 RepID=A0A6G1IDY9_9PLEO|nr:GMC oxidoreductase [Lentithecium fluviatile CBS 122367]